ncbi:penicillin-binding protein 1A [soil metagenome]
MILGAAALLFAGTTIAVAPQLGRIFNAGEAEADEIDLDPLLERSLIFGKDGELMATLHGEQNRSPVEIASIPDEVIQPVLVVEDEDFYEHGGVNLRSISRAFLRNVEAGDVEQGGSTITQQLVKQSLLTNEQSFARKTEEAFLALRLERQMSKDQILERYLNSVYFGNGAYGVQAAAEVYFGTDVEELNWAQGSLLATLIRNPSDNDPIRRPERALALRQDTLQRLVETGQLTEDEAGLNSLVPLPEAVNLTPPTNDYFTEYVKQQLLDDPRYGLGDTGAERFNAVFGGGLRVQTTYDAVAELQAVTARNENLPGENGVFTLRDPRTGEDEIGTGAIASVEPGTGAVRVMVGGPGFDTYKFNLATQGTRQPGSAFKPYVLLAALMNDVVPSDTLDGTGPCTFPQPGAPPYRAENYGGSGGSTGTVTSQTLRSSNCAYLRLGQFVGLEKVVELTKQLGITQSSDLNAAFTSLPLGVAKISPLEMAAAYAAIASDGVYHEPYAIDRIEDREGNLIYEHESEGRRVFDPQVARLATEILEANVRSGTGTRARLPGRTAAGKTGTTNDSADAWFVGYTPQLSTAVWMGSPVKRIPMRFGGAVTGGSYPAQVWGAFMAEYHAGLDPLDFPDAESTRRGRYLRPPGSRAPRSSSEEPRRRSSPERAAPPATSPPSDDDDDAPSTPTTTPRPPPTSPPPTSPPPTSPPSTSPPTTSPPPPDPGGGGGGGEGGGGAGGGGGGGGEGPPPGEDAAG